jgi:hypothetical protein
MTAQQPEHTQESLEILKELQIIKMAWICLIVIFTFFAIGFCYFLYACFYSQGWVSKSVLGGVEGLLVWPMHRIIAYVYPQRTLAKGKK